MAENISPGAPIADQEEVKVQSGRARALAAADLPDKVHTWPYLVRAEFISGCVLLLVLWVGMITIGVFFRGPGWNLFMPWDYWDPHKVVPLTNIDLPYFLGIRSEMVAMLFGLVCVGGWLVGVPGAIYRWKKNSPVIRELGFVRYGIVATLFMIMAGVVVKMFLRHLFNIKYILVIPNILNV